MWMSIAKNGKQEKTGYNLSFLSFKMMRSEHWAEIRFDTLDSLLV